MKIIKFYVFCLLIIVVASCNDVWEDHIARNNDVSDKTLSEMIESDPDLTIFAAYLKKSGYNFDLSTAKYYTVWVPDNNAMASVDAGLINDLVKLQMFVANHIALGQYSLQEKVSSIVVPVKTLNGKNIRFIPSTNTIDGIKISTSDIFVKNGILHKISQPIFNRLNIWEYLMDSVTVANKQIDYMKSLTDSIFVPNPAYQTGYDEDGRPIYDRGKCMVWHNGFIDKVADLRSEDSIFTFFIVDDNVFDSEYAKFKNYFKVVDGTTSSDSAMVRYKITKDYVFSGAYSQPGVPNVLRSLSGVNVPFTGSATLLYRASNGYIYKVTDCSIGKIDKIPTIIIEGETDDKYMLPLISTAGGTKRYKPSASGGFDFILESYSGVNKLVAAEYADGNPNPNAGGIALHVSELASVKYRISWKAVNDFNGSFNAPDTMLDCRQKLGFTQITRIVSNQPQWEPISLITQLYDTIDNKTYPGTEKFLSNWIFSRMRTDTYFHVLCGSSTYTYTKPDGKEATITKVGPVILDYLKLEPIFD
jgi:hypothetical protein